MPSLLRFTTCLLPLVALGACDQNSGTPGASSFVVWAWERPEDLRFLPQDTGVAAQMAFIDIKGGAFAARGRRFPLQTAHAPHTNVIHIEINPDEPVQWSPALRKELAGAVLDYARAIPAETVQIDFEVKQSERPILLHVLHDVRAGLPSTKRLSMTAIASWCNETWLEQAPVDEIVPMLFRMGDGDAPVRARLSEGKDFINPRCRSALAISTDTPIGQAPTGRKIYLFNPNSWSKSDFVDAQKQVGEWQ